MPATGRVAPVSCSTAQRSAGEREHRDRRHAARCPGSAVAHAGCNSRPTR